MWDKKLADIAAAAKEKDKINKEKLLGLSAQMEADRLVAYKQVNDTIKPIFTEISVAVNKVGYKVKTEAPSGGVPPIAFLMISNGKISSYEKSCAIKITYYSGLSFQLETISPELHEKTQISIGDLDKNKIESIVDKLLASTF